MVQALVLAQELGLIPVSVQELIQETILVALEMILAVVAA